MLIIIFSILFIIHGLLELFRVIYFKLEFPKYGRITLVPLFITYFAANAVTLYHIYFIRDTAAVWFILGLSLFTLAAVEREICAWHMKNAYSNTMLPRGDRVVKTGFFSLIRHPIYLSYILELLSFYFLCRELIVLGMLILFVFIILIRINIEEKFLVEKYGDEYSDYQQKTKKLIPFIF